MASSTSNVKIGVCKVFFGDTYTDAISTGDLGYTQGGVEVTVSTDTHDTMIDQFGKTIVAQTIMSRNCKVKVPLAETTLENMVKIMPGATLVGTTTKRVDVPTAVGTDLLSIAKVLVLRPLRLATLTGGAEKAEDFIVWKASTGGALNFAYKVEDERVYDVEFTAYPDANNKLFSYGNEAATA